MIANLKPYSAYKNSGVPWLGDVPEHWGVQRGKWLFRNKKEINTGCQHTNVLSLTLRGVVNNDPDDPEGLIPKDYGTYQFFVKNDLVFKLIDLENLRTSRVGLVHEDGIMSSAYIRLVSIHGGIQRFFFHQYFDLYQRGVYNQLGDGVRATLGAKDLLEIVITIPPSPEQSAIVRYLDYIDRRIRRYIHARQKLIKLLEEQKQAIIHRAVTRGLDPNVRFKPSGIVWMGDVPEHWDVWQVGHFARVGNGSTPSRSNLAYWNGGTFPWLNSSTVNSSPIMDATQFITDLALRECHLPRVQPDSVLVAITGQGKTRGTAAVLAFEATINQHVAYITPRNEVVTPDYLYLALVGSYRELRTISEDAGSTKGALTCGDITHFKVVLPPLDEQVRIIHATQKDTRDVETAVARTKHEIRLLNEYRTSLIADVVTGKLDVREASANLPDEAVEPETIEELDEITEEESEEIVSEL